jgi:diguanylate cyclase (GGDEF)-like protein
MDQMRSSIRDVAVLQQATQMILSSLDVDTVLHHILLVVRNHFGASRCAVFLVDASSNELYCRAQNGFDEAVSRRRLPIGKESVAGWASFTRAPHYVPDFSKEPQHPPNHHAGVQAELALPMLVREQVMGVLDIASDQPDPFSSDAIGLLSLFAGQAAIALENARLHSTELRRMRQMELLNLIARSAAAALDTPQFFSTLADLISDAFEDTQVAIVLINPDSGLSVPACAGATIPKMERFDLSSRSGALAEAFAHRTVVVVDDIAARSGWPACFVKTSSEMCVPLISFGEVLGAVVLAHANPRFFGPDDRSLAQAAADVCATAARNVQLSEELRRVANLDPLTGIYNQRYFHSALAQEIPRARRHKKQFGVVLLDLRGLREVNSVLGMDRGDELLRQAAAALKSSIRGNDVLCRYVSDRFTVLLPEVDAHGLPVVMNKLRQALATIQVPIPNAIHALTATTAVVHYPHDASDELELLKLLFTRLEAAKQQASGTGAV